MKNIKKLGASFLFTAVMLFFFAPSAQATVPYEASNVLGQTSNGLPDFTSSLVDNIPTPNALGLANPYGVEVDSAANLLFVADSGNNRVVVHQLDASNNIIDRTPDYVLGQATFSTRTTNVTANGFDNPTSLAIDQTNTLLYVADTDNNRILIFDYSSISNNMAAVNVLGQNDFTSNSSSKTQSTFTNLKFIEIDSAGSSLYVSDSSRTLIFDVSTIVNGENAVNVLGDADFIGTSTGSSQAQMTSPSGIGIDESGNRLFVADIGYDRILVFDITVITNGESAVNVLGKPDYSQVISSPSAAANTVDSPQGIYYDSTQDYLYVTTNRHYRMVVFDVASITNGENAVNVIGQDDFTSTGFTQTWRARISWPFDVTKVGNTLFVVSQHNYKVSLFDVSTITDGEEAFDAVGQTDYLGNYPTAGTGINNPYNNIDGLDLPYATAVDSVNHRLFVADSDNGRILVYDLDVNDNLIDRTPDELFGQSDFNAYDGFGLDQNSFSSIEALTYDPIRNWLFVADSFVGRVLVFDVSTITPDMDAMYVLGQPDFTTSNTACDQATMAYIPEIAYDSERQLLFAHDWNCSSGRVMVYDVASITNGENAVYVLGQVDFVSGDSSSVTASTFDFAYGLAYDPTTKWLFVSDTGFARVVVFDTTTLSNGMDAVYVLGSNDLVSNGSFSPSQTSFGWATYMTIDTERRKLFVLDDYSRIMIFDIASLVNNEPAVGLLLQDDFTNGTNPYGVSRTMLQGDGGLSFSSIGNVLYAADPYSQRVVQFSFIRISTTSLASANENQVYNKQLAHQNSQGTVSYSLSSGVLPAGVTLSSGGLLGGTPTETGTFPIEITASDNNGIAGIFTDTQSYSVIITADADGDGVSDETESAGPNSGDANGDGIQDSSQPEVSTNKNKVTNGYTTIQSSSGNVSSFSVFSESDLATQNATADFPVGLNSFTISGLSNGASTIVTVFYDQIYDTSTWTFMKYSPTNESYTNMDSSVSYSTANIGGSIVTTASYVLTDGGQFDEDGVANGTIVDPAGPMVISESLADTGISALLYVIFGISITIASTYVTLITRKTTFKV